MEANNTSLELWHKSYELHVQYLFICAITGDVVGVGCACGNWGTRAHTTWGMQYGNHPPLKTLSPSSLSPSSAVTGRACRTFRLVSLGERNVLSPHAFQMSWL